MITHIKKYINNFNLKPMAKEEEKIKVNPLFKSYAPKFKLGDIDTNEKIEAEFKSLSDQIAAIEDFPNKQVESQLVSAIEGYKEKFKLRGNLIANTAYINSAVFTYNQLTGH